MNIGAIQKQFEIIVREKFARHICLVASLGIHGFQPIGTGNLVKHDDRIFILSCCHVIEKALSLGNLEVIFSNSLSFSKKQLSLIQKDEDEDIALLEITASRNLRDLTPLTLDDLSLSSNLREVCKNRPVFVMAGFPFDFATKDIHKNTTKIMPLFYQTVPFSPKRATRTKIYLEYPFGKEDGVKLPKAPGLSGAGIWKVQHISPTNNLWSPTSLKLVAIQHAWIEGKYSGDPYIIGTRVSKLLDWLK